MRNLRPAFVIFCAVTLAPIVATAQLLNGGFESESGTPPQTADNWNIFNQANASTNVTHSGTYSLQTYGPFTPLSTTNFDASGAQQNITSGFSAGQTWVLDGYALNWSGISGYELSGSNSFGVAQMKFFTGGSGGTLLTNYQSTTYGSGNVSMPENVWQHFIVTGTVPVGADTMQIGVIKVGMGACNCGSIFWDDINLYQQTGQVNTNSTTSQRGVQLTWPASVSANTQVQVTTNLSSSTVWTNFGPVWQGTGGTNSITDVFGSTPNKFYNVIQVQ